MVDTIKTDKGNDAMTRKRGWRVPRLLVARVLALGLAAPGGASALSNGDPCSPSSCGGRAHRRC